MVATAMGSPRPPDPHAAYRTITEEDFQRQVVAAIRWIQPNALVYHTLRSEHSEKGFPDIVGVILDMRDRPHPAGGLYRQIAWELKAGRKGAATTSEQAAWIYLLGATGADARVLYPWDMDTVVNVLTGKQ